MEALFGIIAIYVVYAIVSALIGEMSGTEKAAVESMEAFEIRAVEKTVNELKGIIIEGRGLLPVSYRTHIGFVTSVIDKTGDESNPVISMVDGFKEPKSTAYQQIVDAGTVGPDQGFVQWVQIGAVVPSILYPPEGGKRNILIVSRIINMDNPPNINLGYCDNNDPGVLHTLVARSEFYYEGKGYREFEAHRDEARSLSIKLAMSVAMADGSLDDSEGSVINEWIIRTIAPFSEEKQESLKELYNDALRESYSEATSGNLSLSDTTERLEKLADTPQKYEAIELCFEVMAADGVADENEIGTIKNIAESLELDFNEIEKLRDKHLVNLNIQSEQQASIETILHIDQNWPQDQIKKHLREEFAKWNNRLNTLDEGPERNNAQHMLSLIAEARKKYV